MRSTRQRALQVAATSTRFFSPTSTHTISRSLLSATDTSLTSHERDACEVVEQGDALAKIIPSEHYLTTAQRINLRSPWDVHLQELADYDYRPNHRLDMGKFCYDPLTNTVTEAKEKTPTPSYTHTQATSTTLISPHLHTPLFTLFGEEKTPIGLGLVYDLKKCTIKAMFSDTDVVRSIEGLFTFPDLESLTQFRERTKLHSFNNLPQFKAFINANDWKVCNEVAAEVSKKEECLKAIIIDTSDAQGKIPKSILQKARSRHGDIKKRLGRDLPILCYNSEINGLSVYAKDEQHLDELRAQLEAKLDDSYHSPHLPSLRLFAPEDLHYSVSVEGFLAGDINTETARSVLNLIRTYHVKNLSAQQVKEMIKSKVDTKEQYQRFII